jgi:hypothetical protein
MNDDIENYKVSIKLPLNLHPDTAILVSEFAQALAEKLHSSEKKYGYSNGWMDPWWMDECRAQLREHVEKGDPRDVAAYCAFLWWHNNPTVKKPGENCEHKKRINNVIGTLTNTNWKCADCGSIIEYTEPEK